MAKSLRNRTQEHRHTAVFTPLGDDVLLLRHFSGFERLGQLFEYEVDLESDFPDQVDPDKLLGAPMSVRLELADGAHRAFHGLVSRFVRTSTDGELPTYRATMVPWLWTLTRSADCRIFHDDSRQNLTVPKIALQVFREFGASAFRDALAGTYAGVEYCVQYRESAFAFVSRLLEREGIYYFFEHTDDGHTLVLADAATAHAAAPGYAELTFRGRERAHPGEEHVYSWEVRNQVQPGAVALGGYDFKKPANDLGVRRAESLTHANAEFEWYDYPGPDAYVDRGVGEQYARVQLEEYHADREVIVGSATARGIACGHTFTLAGLPGAGDVEYLLTSVRYEIDSDAYESVMAGRDADQPPFTCQFTAIPNTKPFRPPRATPRPMIRGPQTAVIVGAAGDEIHTDEFGRVRVQFPWDRRSKADETSSCWIRVAQGWAGKKWGSVFLPRVGQEVIVEHLEGDPDRPIVTGRVYNGDAKPPYDLPANKTMSTTKSASSPGAAGFNEIRFEDKKGEEQVFIHGEKQLDVRIKKDAFEWIGNDAHLIIKNDNFAEVDHDRHETVKNDHLVQVGRDHHHNVKGKQAAHVAGTKSLTVDGDVIEEFNAKHSEVVTGDYYLKAANICIEAGTNITIKVGQSYIAIEAGGIKIGTTGQIQLESTAPTSIKSGATMDIKANGPLQIGSPMTTIKGDGVMTVQGGIVKIN